MQLQLYDIYRAIGVSRFRDLMLVYSFLILVTVHNAEPHIFPLCV